VAHFPKSACFSLTAYCAKRSVTAAPETNRNSRAAAMGGVATDIAGRPQQSTIQKWGSVYGPKPTSKAFRFGRATGVKSFGATHPQAEMDQHG
jgi:hypothetical protein